jgi:hypothetical protein
LLQSLAQAIKYWAAMQGDPSVIDDLTKDGFGQTGDA